MVVNSEAILEGRKDPLNCVFVIEEDGDDSRVVSMFANPKPCPGLGYRSCFDKGGRFRPHDQHHHQGNPVHALHPETTLVTQFEDVLVDDRGVIYCSDKNHGLFLPAEESAS